MWATGPRGRERNSRHVTIGNRRWSTPIVAVLSLAALSGCTSLTGAATPVATVHPAAKPAGTGADPAQNPSQKDPADDPAQMAPGAPLDGSLAAFYTIPSPLEPAPAGTIIRSAVIASAGRCPTAPPPTASSTTRSRSPAPTSPCRA